MVVYFVQRSLTGLLSNADSCGVVTFGFSSSLAWGVGGCFFRGGGRGGGGEAGGDSQIKVPILIPLHIVLHVTNKQLILLFDFKMQFHCFLAVNLWRIFTMQNIQLVQCTWI